MKLKIRKISRTRKGINYWTWQFIKGSKVSNHAYNSKQTRDKQLAKFIQDIQTENYEIAE